MSIALISLENCAQVEAGKAEVTFDMADTNDPFALSAFFNPSQCFLCEPEAWRTIFSGQGLQVIVGRAPLCPGYVLLAPREHVHTAANLHQPLISEFLTLANIILSLFHSHFGPGYTAYEHGQLGACRLLEHQGDLSTFCHHCHRVMIPRATSCISEIRPWFKHVSHLETPEEISGFAGASYVYYESASTWQDTPTRAVFQDDNGIPSQFMRRILTVSLNSGRDYSWAGDPMLLEMIDSIARLRGALAGISWSSESSAILPSLATPSLAIAIDGLRATGKATVAAQLARYLRCPLIDTSVALDQIVRDKEAPEDLLLERLIQLFTSGDDPPSDLVALTNDHYTEDLADTRGLAPLISHLIERLSPCIVIGHMSSPFLRSTDLRIVLEADLPTRVYRRALQVARAQSRVPNLDELERELRDADRHDLKRLLASGDRRLRHVQTGHRNLASVASEILDHAVTHHER